MHIMRLRHWGGITRRIGIVGDPKCGVKVQFTENYQLLRQVHELVTAESYSLTTNIDRRKTRPSTLRLFIISPHF